MTHEMPEDYLRYIGNVSMLLHSHREPANARVQKVITEPVESSSHQLHHPPPQHRVHHRLHCL
jgi:rRNA pseudouridine-1189 N-methylase Emg1 (Nep1/Mra1 family)